MNFFFPPCSEPALCDPAHSLPPLPLHDPKCNKTSCGPLYCSTLSPGLIPSMCQNIPLFQEKRESEVEEEMRECREGEKVEACMRFWR